jgi:tellurite resistance protein TehA-like permease
MSKFMNVAYFIIAIWSIVLIIFIYEYIKYYRTDKWKKRQ